MNQGGMQVIITLRPGHAGVFQSCHWIVMCSDGSRNYNLQKVMFLN